MIINMRDSKYPHLISGLKKMIDKLPPNMVIAEIGSYAGHSTKLFLDNGSIDHMYCIDPWLAGYDDTDGASYSDMTEVESEFDKRIMSEYDNVTKVKKLSVDAVSDFPDEFFDVVYIDGNHLYDAVIADINAYRPKVKKGGIISGHDYWTQGMVDPKKAVDEIFGEPDFVFEDGSWMVIL